MKKTILVMITACSIFFAGFQKNAEQFSYVLDSENSEVLWNGAGPKGSHQGSFGVTSQGIDVQDGKIMGGTFVIPISSIKNFDLPKTVSPILLKHLKSEDFFNMALYPEASFTLSSVTPLEEVMPGAVAGANVMVTGEFTMLDATHPISFPAKIAMEENKLAVEAQFKLDRTKWGMTYAADPSLDNRHIYPEVDIHLKLSGIKNQQ